MRVNATTMPGGGGAGAARNDRYLVRAAGAHEGNDLFACLRQRHRRRQGVTAGVVLRVRLAAGRVHAPAVTQQRGQFGNEGGGQRH